MSFSTLNKFDGQGHPIKYDNFRTEDEAIARIAELKALGLTDAFYIDDDATAVDGHKVINNPRHWVADTGKKTVSIVRSTFDAAKKIKDFSNLRAERDNRLLTSDIDVLPDKWAAMNDDTKTAWTNYRKALRDLPANTSDPTDVTWPTKPS